MTSDVYSVRFWHRFGTGLVLLMWLALFWPVLTGFSEFGFRDSASLYQPLFEWTRDQWLSGQLPLWCSLDNWGSPVIADATSSVFYPGKLVFLISFVPFSILFGWFTAGHVLLAVFGTRWCAAKFGLSPPSQWLSAVAFGFGGSVLFQTCNVVFLVGAAWLPWAVGCVWQFSQTGKWMDAVRLAVVLAMTILGGDPQMAFHVAMIAAIWWVATVLINSRRAETGLDWQRALTGLLVVVMLAFALSAIQILPSLEWAQNSERMAIHGNESFGDLFDRPTPGTHRDAVYQFSLPPWQVIEMVWPNLSGKLNFATNWRWSSSLAGADRIWTGSLYSGSIIFLLALTSILSGRRERNDYLLIGMLGLFLLGSFGWYGIGWLINELQMMRGGVGTSHFMGEPTGGVYWLMECAIPGYSSFRYPAKLFVIAALAICLLGGRGFDRLQKPELAAKPNFDRRLFQLIVAVLAVSGLLAIAMVLNSVSDPSILALSGSDSFEIYRSLGRTSLLMLVFAVLVHGSVRKLINRLIFSRILFVLCMLELAVAVGWTICTLPVSDSGSDAPTNSTTIYRSHELNDIRYYDDWDNLPVQLDIDRQTFLPKHHLLSGQRLIGSFNSIEPLDLTVLLQKLNELSEEPRDRLLAVLGVDTRVIYGEAKRESSTKAAFKDLNGRARFYFADGIECLPPIDESSYEAVLDRTIDFVKNYSQPIEKFPPRELVECDESLLDAVETSPRVTGPPACVEETSGRIRLRLSAQSQHLLVVTDYFDKNWQAWQLNEKGVRTTRLPVVRVNRVHRGIVTPAGSYDIEMLYHPVWFFRGVWISCVAWAILAGLWFRRLRRR